MEIKLENNLVLSSDENQLTLRKEIGVDKEGKATFKTLGYYSTLEQALEGYLRFKIKTSQATTLQELLNEIKALKHYIKMLSNGGGVE